MSEHRKQLERVNDVVPPRQTRNRGPFPDAPQRRRRARRTAEDRVLDALRRAVITVAVIATAGPLLYGILLSLRPFQSVVAEPLDLFPAPDEITLDAYPTAIAEYGLGGNMANSLQVAVATAGLAILFSVLGAYAAVRLRFFGRNAVNVVFLGVYLLPGIVLAVPLFVLLSRVGLTGTLVGLVFVYVAQTVPVALYMLRTYLMAVPSSAGGSGDDRRLRAARAHPPRRAADGAPRCRRHRPVRVHDRLERVPVRVALPCGRPRPVDGAHSGSPSSPSSRCRPRCSRPGSIAVTVPVVAGFFLAQRMLISGLTAGAEKG